jgi:hypothetical protein
MLSVVAPLESTSGGGTVAEHSPYLPTVEGLSKEY